jgi:hypothetical protein
VGAGAEVKDALLDLLDVLNKCKARFLKVIIRISIKP